MRWLRAFGCLWTLSIRRMFWSTNTVMVLLPLTAGVLFLLRRNYGKNDPADAFRSFSDSAGSLRFVLCPDLLDCLWRDERRRRSRRPYACFFADATGATARDSACKVPSQLATYYRARSGQLVDLLQTRWRCGRRSIHGVLSGHFPFDNCICLSVSLLCGLFPTCNHPGFVVFAVYGIAHWKYAGNCQTSCIELLRALADVFCRREHGLRPPDQRWFELLDPSVASWALIGIAATMLMAAMIVFQRREYRDLT